MPFNIDNIRFFAGGVPGDGRQGYGKDMSMYSIEDYTVVKHVMARLD